MTDPTLEYDSGLLLQEEEGRSTEPKRLLVVVNPYATTVSEKLKSLVVYALQARYQVEAVETRHSGHATELAAEAASEDFDLVVAFGGDGTLNEVANGLAGTQTPVTPLPGGSTNVICQTLGIPLDLIDAAERLISIADDFVARPFDLGVANGRRFLFASGFGLDAEVVRRADTKPDLKGTAGKWFYAWSALSSFYSYCLGSPPRVEVDTGSETLEGATAIVQNSDPFTYFGDHPIHLCEDVMYDDGRLALAVLDRFAQRDVPSLIPRLLSSSLSVPASRRVRHFSGLERIQAMTRATESSGEDLPLHVDGDCIGYCDRVEWSVEPGALQVVC